MKIGTSLRGHFPMSQASLDLFHAYVDTLPRGAFVDVPAGDFDTRTQARNLIEVAHAAREARLDFLLVGDHHAVPISNFFQPTPTLGRLLAETGDMPVGILYLAPFYHPVLLAEQVGTLAAFAPEPFTVALALGEGAMQFEAFEITERSRVSRTEECVAIVRRLLAGETVTHEGRRHRLRNVRINPVPAVPSRMWIAGRVGPAVERAGRLGDGWLTGTTSTDAELAVELARYRAACDAAGRVPNPILRKDVHIGASDREARDAVAPFLEAGYRSGMGWDEVIVGDPTSVVDRLRHYDAMGFSTVLVRHIVGDHTLMLDSFRRLGSDVLPRVRDLQ